jgi:hypothetical protein
MKLPAACCMVFWRSQINKGISRRLGAMVRKVPAPTLILTLRRVMIEKLYERRFWGCSLFIQG